MTNGSNLVIKQQKSNLWYASVASIIVLLVVGTFIFGRYLALSDLSQTKQELTQAQQALNQAEKALEQAKESLVMQQQSSQVDNLSTQELANTVKQMQLEQNELLQELKFYRRILAPELDKDGLTIDSFSLAKTETPHQYHFKTTLIQAGKQNTYLKGDLVIKVSGLLVNPDEPTDKGKEVTYSFKQLGSFKPKFFQFQFKYFNNFQGFIQLPQGFTAKTISIKAKTKGRRKNQTANKQLIWKPEERQNYARYE